jgi:hypothetical protein
MEYDDNQMRKRFDTFLFFAENFIKNVNNPPTKLYRLCNGRKFVLWLV